MIGSTKSFVLAFMELMQDICTILVTTLKFAGKGWMVRVQGEVKGEIGISADWTFQGPHAHPHPFSY